MILDRYLRSSIPPLHALRHHFFFFHISHRPHLGIKVDLHDPFLRRDDFDFLYQSAVFLLKLSLNDCP